MKKVRFIMGMPVIVEIVDPSENKNFEEVFNYFKKIDKIFSTYKKDSEISKINRGELRKKDISKEIKTVFNLVDKTKKQTNGYFNIFYKGRYDPAGIVKGWAINNATDILKRKGYKNFYVNAGEDIQVFGKNKKNKKWKIGIANPFNEKEIIKIVYLDNHGIATSGNYSRGIHIYDPVNKNNADAILSITIIGDNVYDADRFATATFAMGADGINFVEKTNGLEGYMIDKKGIVTYTNGFNKFTKEI